jgi:methionyl-tRNA synthetase
MNDRFVSTAIPYVNAAPHIGFALELVIADVVARHARLRGHAVHFTSGTDDNSLKNALSAQAEGVPPAEFVRRHAEKFAALKSLLNISYDDFVQTSVDPRHAAAVAKLWHACARSGDIYQADYAGLYCVGCEQFYTDAELLGGVCPEHRTPPEPVSERNHFFRLSRYRDELVRLIASDAIAIRPASRKHEVLAFLDAPLADLSISRSVERARGWGLAVPGDDSQIVYVWFDALANYISTLDFASQGEQSGCFARYWTHAQRITHVIGKGVVRFHAVYWPAILLSAGLRPPSEILVHGYITIAGEKISKSLGNTISPDDACARYGPDPLRYYLLRHIGSQRDGDFSWGRFDTVYETELANQLGNLLSRTVALARRCASPIDTVRSRLAPDLADEIDQHIEAFALDRALDAIWAVVVAANAYVNRTEPWNLVKHGDFDAAGRVLAELYATLRGVGLAIRAFLPATADRILAALDTSTTTTLFPRRGSESL